MFLRPISSREKKRNWWWYTRNSQDLFQQLDLTVGTNYNQYLIMVKRGESDGDIALYRDTTFLPGILLGFSSFLKDNF